MVEDLSGTILPRLHKQARIEWALDGFDALSSRKQRALGKGVNQGSQVPRAAVFVGDAAGG